jgi:hypothetical protein
MSDEVDEALGIASAPAKQGGPGTPTEQVLQQILTEARKQTRNLSVIRWLLVLAWLTVLAGGIRVAMH